MANSTRDGEAHEDEIRLWREDDGWVAKDIETGVTTQGQSRETALENFGEAVALHTREIGREPTDEELREMGIKPSDNTTGDRSPPDVLDQNESPDVFGDGGRESPGQRWRVRMAADD